MKSLYSRKRLAVLRGFAATALGYIVLLEAVPQILYGYVDPGSGILALQMIAAVAVGALFQFRRWVILCVKRFRRPKNT